MYTLRCFKLSTQNMGAERRESLSQREVYDDAIMSCNAWNIITVRVEDDETREIQRFRVVNRNVLGGETVVEVRYQPTPNPNSVKFMVNRQVVESGNESYMDKEAAQSSPLAKALFDIDGVASVFMLGNFITVSKSPEASWDDLVGPIENVIQSHFS